MRQWVAEGRANAQTQARFGDGAWKTLATFPEFSELFSGAGSVPPLISPLPPLVSGPPQERITNSCTVGGFVCACLGLIPCCCAPLAIAGLGLCIAGYYQILHEPNRFSTSRGLAIAGITVAIVGLLLNAGMGCSGSRIHID